VQSAAQDEMAFEQRATVTENPENFVLGHGADCQVSGFKFQARIQRSDAEVAKFRRE
jgi:hypothetical protein